MKSKTFLDRLKAALRRVLYRRPGFYAECCCGLRGPRYIGNFDAKNSLQYWSYINCPDGLKNFGCLGCKKFARGCWGPQLRTY